MSDKERAELKRLRRRHAFGGIDRRYRRWTSADEERYRALLQQEKAAAGHVNATGDYWSEGETGYGIGLMGL